jgi:hypothetical protein
VGTITLAGGGGGYDTVEDETTPLTQRSTLGFAGASVNCADSGGETVCTFSDNDSGHVISDEGIAVVPSRGVLDFVGPNVSCADSGGVATVCTFTDADTDTGHLLFDEGMALITRTKLDFTGAGVTCTDDNVALATVCDIPGGGGSSHELLSATHTDTLATGATHGDLIYADGSTWKALPTAVAGRFLKTVTAAPTTLPSWEIPAFSDLSGTVADAQIAAGAVDGGNGGEIADGSITADDLGADSVSSSELNATGVEAELEAELDLSDLQGAVTDAQVPNNITVTLAATATALAANPADCATSTHFAVGVDASGVATCEAIQAGDVPTLNQNTTGTAAALTANGANCATGAAAAGVDASGAAEGCFTPPGYSVLGSDVAVAVNATYVTVFTITPAASKKNNLRVQVFHQASATTVGMQFRVRSADAGNVGVCAFTHFGINATASSNVGTFMAVTAIGAAPVDTASLASFATNFNEVNIDCAWTSDGTPGDVIVEAQLETGTTSTNILAGSSYLYLTN